MFQRLAGPFRSFGFFPGLVWVIHRLLGRISAQLALFYHDWMVQPIPEKPLLSRRRGQMYETREIPMDDPLIDRMPIRPEVRVSRREQDTVCLATFRKDELVGYIWLSFGTYEEDMARCTFVLEPESESVFDFDLYIPEEHRMGMAFAAVWDGAAHYLRERGVKYTYSRMDHFNLKSASAHDHFGWKPVGRALILRLWSVEVILASISPHVSLLLTTSQRARIKLTPDALREAG